MRPTEICRTLLSPEKLAAILEKLTTPQVKAVLKEGDVKVKLPGGYVSQQKRRELWSSKILAGLEQGNDILAAELLQQWLLNHRRAMLVAFLDRLEVKHRHGETDESFLISRPAEKVREASSWLLTQEDRSEALAYLAYIAYQQRSTVLDGWEGLSAPPSEVTPADAGPASGPTLPDSPL
jgi:hypothetical protein